LKLPSAARLLSTENPRSEQIHPQQSLSPEQSREQIHPQQSLSPEQSRTGSAAQPKNLAPNYSLSSLLTPAISPSPKLTFFSLFLTLFLNILPVFSLFLPFFPDF